MRIPHSFRGLVGQVPAELGHSETGLHQERDKANELHVDADLDQQEGERPSSQGEGQQEETVVSEARPSPEIVDVKI